MAKAILLCGVQASGKSTYVARLGIVVHSRDEVRQRLRSKDASVSEDVIWNTVIEEMTATLRSGQDAALDSTLANSKRRDEAIRIFGEIALIVEIHRVHTSLTECHRRNNNRPADTKVRPADIDRTYRQLQEAFVVNPPRCRVLDVSGNF